MTSKFEAQAVMKLQSLLSSYESRGYSPVPTSEIPKDVAELQPDLVVRRGEETIVVELKGGHRPSGSGQAVRLERMAEVLEEFPDWKLELQWLGAPPAERLSRDQASEVISRALAVRQVDASAALLLTWSAVEITLDQMISVLEAKNSIPFSPGAAPRRSPKQMVSLAQSLGLIPEDVYDVLLRSGDARNGIAHGFRNERVPSVEMLADELIDTAQRILPESYVSPDQMVDWFRERYEDPAESVPYDSREGGYQYSGNGPFDADDVLRDNFADADERDIQQAVRILESESVEWVSIERIQ
ncbi:HEPN-associated N-terminal domain-containing protein [Streptomyces griseus]|uniref:HEPN-associated N-terminal domain-containing protein n=1 Tax=Streptomyces griseus TaxID=1911 RepID=UPI00379E4B8F